MVVLNFAFGTSHAPNCFYPPKVWPEMYRRMVLDLPQPKEAEKEKRHFSAYWKRINKSFAKVRKELLEYNPDVIVMAGDDQREVFNPDYLPTFAIYTGGPTVKGTTMPPFVAGRNNRVEVTLRCHETLSNYLLEGLTERGFDMMRLDKVHCPPGVERRGLGHAFTNLALQIQELTKIPVVILFVNCYFPPLPTSQRCYELGQAIEQLLETRKEKVAIYASGGLSHDVMGARAGWIDEPLDRWVLDNLAEGKGDALRNLFTHDSAQLRAGTGELRNWTIVAGAVGTARANVVDYFPLYHSVTGLAFAYWPEREIKRARESRT